MAQRREIGKRTVALSAIIGVLIGAGITYAVAGPSLGRPTAISVSTTTLTPSTVTTTTTSTQVSIEFEGPGVKPCINTMPPIFPCADGFQIDSASLSAPAASGDNGTLTVTLAPVGNYNEFTVSIALNRTGMLTAPAFGVEHTYAAQVPSTFVGATTQTGDHLNRGAINLTTSEKFEVLVDLTAPCGSLPGLCTDEIRIFLIAS